MTAEGGKVLSPTSPGWLSKRTGCSNNVFFTIDEVVNHCCEEKEKVYAAYMDITMWIDAMLYKLHYNKVIVGKTWRLIKNWYMDMKKFVFIGGKASRTYNLHHGTRQGGVLSPWLFLVLINVLIEGLKNTKAGIFLGTFTIFWLTHVRR